MMQYRVEQPVRCAGCARTLAEGPVQGPAMAMEVRWYLPSQNKPVSVCSIGCLGTLALSLGVAQQDALTQARTRGAPPHLLGEGRP